ncbi:MAG: YifB family Mg chelatase-like AAA ATPase [Gammaproteobacteria bacterium WSBS_2016_MAG_OTU1]
MAFALLHSRVLTGVYAAAVKVEVHVSSGSPQFNIVGLRDTEVKEVRKRVRIAILSSNFSFPDQRITINLAPANMPKEGGRYDLPIALGILVATGQVTTDLLNKYEFSGELTLNGKLRSCGGALPITLAAMSEERALVMSPGDAAIGTLANDAVVHTAFSLQAVCAHLSGHNQLPIAIPKPIPAPKNIDCLSDVKGQVKAKRALEVAAAGGHSMLMMGPPGCGKSMLASRLSGLMPLLTYQEALHSASVRSLPGGDFELKKWRLRPFRKPHHSTSAAALIGGGNLKPGEVSLAHHGILFLDELPEFDRQILEGLHEPMESGVIPVPHASRKANFPARFQLIAAMNPCPCGYQTHPTKVCCCTPDQISRYRSNIPHPLLDEIDIHIEVMPLSQDEIAGKADGESSALLQEQITMARNFQIGRQEVLNSRLGAADMDKYCLPDTEAQNSARSALGGLGLSVGSYHRILKIARTIADLAHEEDITAEHLNEAIQYRRLVFEGFVA